MFFILICKGKDKQLDPVLLNITGNMNAVFNNNSPFVCFYCKYMWKEIVREFSKFGKEVLSKKENIKIFHFSKVEALVCDIIHITSFQEYCVS